MKNEIANLSEIAALASKLVGLVVEVTALISKKAADFEEHDAIKALADAIKIQATAMESEIALLQRELKKAHKNTNESEVAKDTANASFSSDVNTAKKKMQTELVEGDEKKIQPLFTERSGQEGIQPLTAEAQEPCFTDLKQEEVEAATFPKATDKTVFTKALSDMTNQDAALRVDAAKVLAGIRHELSVRVLVNQLGREHSAKVRQECVRSLAALRMNEGITAVETAITDQAAQVRLVAVWSLYQLAGAESVPVLIRTLSDEDEEVRRRAITCIGWLARDQKTVGMIGTTDSRLVVSALVRCLEDPEISVRSAALGALEAVTGKKMSKPGTTDSKDLHQDTIAQWKKWWRLELLG
ncbi:MAG: HEAT repeat domain-containing protein [Planctomycetota bacterium]|jgi:hypothetical protein